MNLLQSILRVFGRHKVEIYITVIIHLCLLILLLLNKVHSSLYQPYAAIELSYEQPEIQDRVAELAKIKADLEQEVNKMLMQSRSEVDRQQAQSAAGLQNKAVNEESHDGSSQGGSAISDVLEENNALQDRLASTQRMVQESHNTTQGDADFAAPAEKKAAKKSDKPYVGPSVLSFLVAGRKAYYLPVPVYKCEGGGEVVVDIEVAQNGSVTGAQVNKAQSASNDCLHQAACQAALRSKFSVSNENKTQQGKITYRFVSQ